MKRNSKLETPETFRRFNEMRLRASGLAPGPRQVAEAIISRLKERDWRDFSLPEDKLDELLWADKSSPLEMFQEGSDETAALEALIGPDQSALALGMWRACPAYPFPYLGKWRPGSDFFSFWNRSGLDFHARRPPYRSRDSRIYYRPALFYLLSFITALARGFTLEGHLAQNSQPQSSRPSENSRLSPEPAYVDEAEFIPRLIALTLDGDERPAEKLLNRLRSILNKGPALQPQLGRQIISGLLKSGREQALALATEILMGAEIMDGSDYKMARFKDDRALAVVELMVSGRRRTFVSLLNLLAKHNLARIPEVSQAFISWTGLAEGSFMWADLDDQFSCGYKLKDLGIGGYGWVGEALGQAGRCLTDESYRRSALTSAAPLKTMLALWAGAASDLESAQNECRELLKADLEASRLGAVAFAASIGHPARRFELLRPLLDEPAFLNSPELTAMILDGLSFNLFELDCRNSQALPYEPFFRLKEEGEVAIEPATRLRPTMDHRGGGELPRLEQGDRDQSRAKVPDFIYLTAEEAGAYYLSLRRIQQNLDHQGGGPSVSSRLLPGFPMHFGRTGLAELMIYPLLRTKKSLPGKRPKPSDSMFSRSGLPLDHPIEKFKRRWRFKQKTIYRELLVAGPDQLDRLELPIDGRPPLIRDDFCAQPLAGLSSTTSNLTAGNLMSRDPSAAQRRILISWLVEGYYGRVDLDGLLLSLSLTDEELLALEDVFRRKYDPPRKLILMKIMMELEDKPHRLEAVVNRLRKDEHPLKRKAAEELTTIIRRRKDQSPYKELYESLKR